MSRQAVRRGRPWTPLSPELDADTAELLRVLRELIDHSGIGLKGFTDALTSRHFNGVEPPGYNTLSRRLKGDGIGNDGYLIAAVVQLCVAPEKREAKAKEVERLRIAALTSSQQKLRTPPADRADRQRTAGLGEALRRIRELEHELAQERRRSDQLLTLLGHVQDGAAAGSVLRQRPVAPPDALQQGLVTTPSHLPPMAHGTPRTVLTHPSEGPVSLEAVAAELRALDPAGERIGGALRTAMDETLDGQHTGRYRLDQLYRAEKIYLGTKFQIVLAAVLGLKEGAQLDFSIAGHDVDMVFTQGANWAIPPEALGHVCVLVQLDERRSDWSIGLLTVDEQLLQGARNRGGMQSLSRAGREAVRWLFRKAPLPDNTLHGLAAEDVAAIMSYRRASERVGQLLRTAQHRRIGPSAVATVAMQPDSLKRLRDLRPILAREGIATFSRLHAESARALGLPAPEGHEVVTARLASLGEDEPEAPYIELEGRRWALARPGDPVEPVPALRSGP